MRLGISIVAILVCLAAVGPAAAAAPVDGPTTQTQTPAKSSIAPQATLTASTAGSTSPGGTVSITYTLENTGDSKASAGRLELQTGSDVTPVSASGDGTPSLDGDPPTVFYGFAGEIAPGETRTTTVTFEVDADADLGDKLVAATGYVGSKTDTVQSSISVADSDRAALAAPGSVSATAGEQFTVTYDLTNNASVAANGGRLELRPPEGVTAVSISGDGSPALSGTPPTVFYGFSGPIAAGETVTTTVTYEVTADAQSGLELSATGFVEDSQTTVRTEVTFGDPLARFDTNGQAGIQGDEIQAAIIAFNTGGEVAGQAVTAQQVQQIIIAFNGD